MVKEENANSKLLETGRLRNGAGFHRRKTISFIPFTVLGFLGFVFFLTFLTFVRNVFLYLLLFLF